MQDAFGLRLANKGSGGTTRRLAALLQVVAQWRGTFDQYSKILQKGQPHLSVKTRLGGSILAHLPAFMILP